MHLLIKSSMYIVVWFKTQHAAKRKIVSIDIEMK